MQFIHSREHLSAGDSVVVNSSHQCNIWVTDDTNFRLYKSGQRYRGFGGGYRRFPVRIDVPTEGYWNVTIDLGGGQASIRHSISYIRA
ncbi:DUF1883 domain-containing protein [Alcaligenaceae bacterium A4P071]|nr:DUF1883 domain-containing protein [Alcaligenaceae bacterium A4P071]